jgi:hypothetical protein
MGLLNLLTGQEFTLEHSPIDFGGGRSAAPKEDLMEIQPGFSVRPNPSDGRLVVTLEKEENEVEVAVFSISSFPVKTFRFARGDRFELDLQSLPNGVYYIRVKAGETRIGFEKVVLTD